MQNNKRTSTGLALDVGAVIVSQSFHDTICLTGQDGSRRPPRYASLGVPLHGHIHSTRILVSEYIDHWNHDCAAEKELSYPHQFEEAMVHIPSTVVIIT